MQKNVWIVIGVGTAVVAALFAWNWFLNKGTAGDALQDAASILTITDTDWTKGNPDASVVLIEYSDFECPACAAYYPVVKRLVEEYGDRVMFVYRHFPLTNIHHEALSAAFAAEAAGAQGKFWEMHDMLFERQGEWAGTANATEVLFVFAEELSLDMERFANDTDDKTILNNIERSYKDGFSIGVNGTPTFFLNGTRITNPQSYEAFKTVVESAFAE